MDCLSTTTHHNVKAVHKVHEPRPLAAEHLEAVGVSLISAATTFFNATGI